ncbi:NAC domain-containing protein 83-like [Macadamia integrifolia]|uniref:NAC domain-containing protein 83-like n=1 Tax=Macadamia integrifolia TaxID=60698 RepID=UPI001C4F390A|nr:NAC domain-containing protein 83-like [Macadamia integrifolia]
MNGVTMCPSAPVPSLGNIEFHFTDEELVDHLERMDRGAPLPANVIPDLNPYNVLPWNLPDDVWCFFNSLDPKATGTGYWKATGERRSIPKNATTTACRTTLQFYRGKAPYGTKTDWMMYEYKLYRQGLSEMNEALDSSSLCRVFLNSIQSPNHEEHHNRTRADNANGVYIHPMSAIRVNGYGSTRSQVNSGVNENGPTAVSERNLPNQRPDNPVQDLRENYDFSAGDFIELLDLVNPESPSSSENSSCLTMSSDEYFDSLALLRDIEAENTQKNQTNSTFCVSTSHGPKQLVLKPTSSGSAVQQHVLENKMQKLVTVQGPRNVLRSKMHKHVVVQGLSTNSANAVASSSGLPADSGGERKVVGWMTKLRKKFCCFMPF